MRERNTKPFLTGPRLFALIAVIVLLIAVPLGVTFALRTQFASTFGLATSTPQSNPTGGTTSSGAPAGTVLSLEQSILDNMKSNGYNNNSDINHGLGGLWVNWKYGSTPLQANFNGTGSPDGGSVSPPRHDPLTDIRYLHALWLYQSQNPTDTRYKSEIDKYTAIIKAEFNQSKDERGWLFDEEFMELYNLSHDSFYKDTAMSLVQSYANRFDPKVGTIYKTNDAHTMGSYRVDLVLEEGCALIQAGTLFQNSDWTQKGQSVLNFVYAHAYISQYHTFPDQVDNVRLQDGSTNSSESFFKDSVHQSYTVSGNQVTLGSISQIILSLLHTYQVTHTQDYLNKATDLLDPLSMPQNTLGLWDTTNMGYFIQANFSGTGPQDPGKIKIKSHNKEAGRQITILQDFHLANSFTNNKYQNMESLMRKVAVSKAYYAPGHGVVYEVDDNWTPIVAKGVMQDWVTTEAMGAELEGLFTIDAKASTTALTS